MPGTRIRGEGAFYRFDDIHDPRQAQLPSKVRWWFVPDQFTLARLDALRLQPYASRCSCDAHVSSNAPFGPRALPAYLPRL